MTARRGAKRRKAFAQKTVVVRSAGAVRCARRVQANAPRARASFYSLEHRRAAMADVLAPRAGDRILLFRPAALALVLQGEKTMDARKINYKPGRYLLGCDGRIHAVRTPSLCPHRRRPAA